MKKLGMMLGVAAVAVVSGCKDPDYKRAGSSVQNEVKETGPVEAVPAETPKAAPVVKCTCPRGTTHTSPCACGAPDCACIVMPKPLPPPPPVEPEYTIYIVQNGDYLSKISKRYNVTISSIKRLNGLKSDVIRVGQRLKLPGRFEIGEQKVPDARKATVSPRAKVPVSTAPYSGATKEYVVKNGDTLGAIAYGHGINIRQLKALNGLTSDALKVGQKLKVPADKASKKVEKAAPEKTVAPKAVVPAASVEKKPETPVAPPTEGSPSTAVAEPLTPPVSDSAASAETAAAPATVAYTVQEGEDITSIVVKFGVNASEIRELNNLGEGDTLKAGQTIKIPAEAQQ